MAFANERTPTLHFAIPLFEKLLTLWEELSNKKKSPRPNRIEKLVNIGLEWAVKYYKKLDNSQAYTITMCTYLIFFMVTCIAIAYL